MTDFDSFTRTWECHRQTLTRANDHNKTALFDALTAAAITSIAVHFDGEGDSGQIDNVTAFTGNKPVDLPKTTITVHRAEWGIDDLRISEETLSEAIEILCYGYLEHRYGGWENNDGAYGEFIFDVAERSIHLDFNARFTDCHNFTHNF